MPGPAPTHRVARIASAVVAVLALTFCAPAQAIDEGVPDRDGHPNVGALGFDPDGVGEAPANLLCTGSVLSDTVFLTAAHCITAFPDAEWVVTLEPGAPAVPMTRPGIVFDEFPLPFLVAFVRAREVVLHPRFDPETRRHDVALILLPPGTFAGVAPVELPKARALDRLARRGGLRGKSFRLVGYGADPEWGDGEPRYILEGYRQTATAPFRKVTSTQLLLGGDPRRTGQGGLCLGDSGSPQLLEGTNVAVSLLSTPGDTCREGIRGQRLDVPPVRRFLSRYVELP